MDLRFEGQVTELFTRKTVPEIQSVIESSPSLEISEVDLQWAQVVAEGWASPLTGFMREEQYLQALHFNTLVGDTLVTMPLAIVLPVSGQDKERLTGAPEFCLNYNGKAVGLLKNPEFFTHRKEERCARQFGTTSPKHPYIKVKGLIYICRASYAIFLRWHLGIY